MTVVEVATPQGPARLHVAAAADERLALLLGHGAGGGVNAPDLVALARALPPLGVTVVRVEQPWRVAGRRVATAPPRLDEAWLACAAAWRSRSSTPVVVGGRSAGARVACRTAQPVGARSVVALAFPLHPPGRPERSRAAELLACGVPVLVVQGSRDTFGGPDDVAAAVPGATVVRVEHADHSFRVTAGRSRADALAGVVDAVRGWLATSP